MCQFALITQYSITMKLLGKAEVIAHPDLSHLYTKLKTIAF